MHCRCEPTGQQMIDGHMDSLAQDEEIGDISLPTIIIGGGNVIAFPIS